MENREYLKNNIKNVYFKLKLVHHDEKSTKLTNDEIEAYLTEIYKTDLSIFLNQYEIFYNSYNISFMIDNSNNYYLKFQIIPPGLNDLLINKNYQCIYQNCYEMILNIKGSFCPSHTEMLQQLNPTQYDKLLKNHSDDLKKIYETFTAQNNLYNYFINFNTIDITEFIKNENNHSIQCFLEVIKKKDNMIDIDIPLDLHENLYFKFITNSLSNHTLDSDDESSLNDSEINLDDLDVLNVDINSLYNPSDDSENELIDDLKINNENIETQQQETINIILDDKENYSYEDVKNNSEPDNIENDDIENDDTENDECESIFSDSDSGSEIDYKLNKDDINQFLQALKIMKNMKTNVDS